MSKTIKQIAAELGVSKTAVRKYMTLDFRKKYVQTDGNGILQINEEGENLLQSLRKQPQTPQTKFSETIENQGLQGVVDIQKETIGLLKGQLAAKDEQIRAQQSQIEQLTAALQQQTAALESTAAALTAAQSLHAADKKTLMLLDEQDGNERKLSFWARRRAEKAKRKRGDNDDV